MFSKSYRWLVLGITNQDEGIVASEFNHIDISVDSEVIIAQEKGNNDILLNASE